MPKGVRVSVNKERLWKLAQEGKSIQEIMVEMGTQNKNTIINTLNALMVEKREFITVRDVAGRSTRNVVKYGKGGIKLSPKHLEETGLEEGDAFSVKISSDGTITLTKL